MLQVNITPTKPEYAKYAFDLRFICESIEITEKGVEFKLIWEECGWNRIIPLGNGYFNIEIKEIK